MNQVAGVQIKVGSLWLVAPAGRAMFVIDFVGNSVVVLRGRARALDAKSKLRMIDVDCYIREITQGDPALSMTATEKTKVLI